MQEMEHYASDLLLSQDGYRSIDFTLLDRPSGSIASAPEATASLLPDLRTADSSFPSFDFSDGAGVESFDDTSLRNHGSFRPGVLKHPDTRSRIENSVQSSSRIMQSQGVHDFFEQDNRQPSDVGNWPWDGKRVSNDQSQLFYSGPYSAEEANGRNFLLNADRYGTNARMNLSGCALSSSEVTNTDLGVSSMHSFLPTTCNPTDNGQSSQAKFSLTLPQEITGSTVIRTQPRNQPLNVEGLWNVSQNTQFKPSHPAMFGNSTLTNHTNSSSLGGYATQVQNQNARFLGQNLEGAIVEPPSYGYRGSQLLLRGQGQGTLGQGQTALGQGVSFGQQTGSSGRSAGLTDGQLQQQQSLLSQHQLQEMHRQLVLQQLKQHSEQIRQHQMQQQAYTQFPGISYSALLHGNDSPSPSPVPSPQPQPQPQMQPQLLRTTGGLPVQGLENNGAAFLTANFTNASTGGLGWPLNGSSYHQGLTNDFLMGQDPNLAWQLLASKGFQVEPALQIGNARDVNGPVLAFYSGAQNPLLENYGGGSRLPSNSQIGKPVPRPLTSGTALVPEVQADSFGLCNGPISDPKHTQQVQLNQFSGQHLQRPDVDSMEQNQIDNSLHFMNMLSKSQNHFQDFQASEERNWDPSERKWDSHIRGFSQPLKSSEFLPGNIPNAQESNLQNSTMQNLNTFDNRSRLAGTGQFLQQGSCQPGHSKPESIVGFKQQRYWSTPGMGTSINDTDDENDQQNMDPWSSLQGHEIHSDSGSHGQLLPNANRNIWGSNFPQQRSSLIGNSFQSIDSSKSRQIAFHNVQSPQQANSKNGRERESSTTIADTNFQSNQRSSYSYVDLRSSQEGGWKENDRVTQTIHMLPASLEPDGHSQGSWKNHTSPIQSPDGVDTTRQVADGDGHGSRWICDFQQGIVETEAPYRMKLAPRKPNLANRQESPVVQHANERLFTGEDMGPQQSQSQDIPDYLGNQHGVNVIRAVSDQDCKLVSNQTKEMGTPFHEKSGGSEVQATLGGADVDLGIARNSLHPNKYFTLGKNPSMEKQKELSQSTDANASISLAHFRGNQSSSSLSPQSIRLGLGPPSHMSHILQQGGSVNLSKFAHVQGSVTPDVQTHPYNSGYDSQTVGGDRGDISQVASQVAGSVLGTHSRVPQNTGESSSMQTSSIPSIISNENMPEALLPSNIMSKHRFLMASEEEACIGAPSQFMIPFENTKGASGSSQTEWNLEENFDSTPSQVWPDVGSCGFTQDLPSTHRTAQPSSMHENPSHPTHVGSSMHNMQERNVINMVMQQLGERDQGADFSGMLSTLKASLPGQSKYLADRDKTFQGVFRSFQLPSGGVQGDQAPMLQEALMNADKPMTSRISCGEGLSLVPMTSVASQNLFDEYSDQFKAHQEKSFNVLEPSGSQPKFQEQKRPSLGQIPETLLNGGRPTSGGPGQGQDLQKRSNFFLPIAMPPRLGAQLRGSDKLDKGSPAFLSQGQSVQQQTDASREGLSSSHMSEGLLQSDARAALFSESAVKPGEKWNEAIRKPPRKQLKPGSLGGSKASMKGSINQQVPHALAAPGQNKGRWDLKTMPHQNVLSSEVSSQSNQDAADELPLVPALPSHAVGNLVVGVTSNSCIGQNVSSTHTNAEASCRSEPYLGSSTSEQSLPLQASIYHNLNAGGRALALSQQFSSKSPGQAVLYGGQPPHTPVGVTDPVLKEGESRYFAKSASAVLDQISHNHFSPLKSNLTFHPKKRKKQVPPLIPWHVAATQPRSHLMSAREAELRWANAMNRLPEKDDGECHDEGMSSVGRAKRRLRSTTQLMQQLIPPLPGAMMHGNLAMDNECATYTLAKLALGDACRLVAGTRREAVPAQIGVDNKNMALNEQGVTRNMAKEAAMSRIVESFMINAKRLDNELARLDSSATALELTCEANDSEKLSIVNRLARHHGTGFSLDSFDNVHLENVSDIGPGARRPLPQKYVTAVPMPRTLPEGVKCLSL